MRSNKLNGESMARGHILSRHSSFGAMRWVFSVALIALIASIVSFSSSIWVSANGTGGPGGPPTSDASLFFRDSNDLPLEVLSISSIGQSVRVFLYVEGLVKDESDTFQMLLTHDSAVTLVENATCEDIYDNPVSAGDISPSSDGMIFNCEDAAGVQDSDGYVVSFDIERIGYGDDVISLSIEGDNGTSFFTVDEPTVPSLPNPINILNLPAPAATATPSGGGGGGGGGGFIPQPTPTSAPQQFAPGVPTDVVASVGDGFASLSWSPPASNGGAPITGYQAMVFGTSLIQNLPANARNAVFSDLENGEPVRMRVRAINAIGPGQYSVLNSPIAPAGPTSPPENVVASVGPGDATIMVEWSPPADNNGSETTGYVVIEKSDLLPDRDLGADVLSTVFENLPSGTYSFVVRATNSAGISEDSAETAPITVLVSPTPVSGAPGDQPTPIAQPSRDFSVQISDEDKQGILDEISTETGAELASTDSPVIVQKRNGNLTLALPFSADSSAELRPFDLTFEAPSLSMNFTDSSGVFQMTVSEETGLVGSGAIAVIDGDVAVVIDTLRLRYSPSSNEIFGPSVQFFVDLTDAPGDANLESTYLYEIQGLLDELARSTDIPTASSGSILSTDQNDLGPLVKVSVSGADSSIFGANTVSFSIASSWLAQRAAAGREIVVVKVSDSGVAYTQPADCMAIDGAQSVCSATFDGAASGFSTFGLVGFVPSSGQPTSTPSSATATPTMSPTAEATPSPAGPSPTPVSGSGLGSPGDAPTPTVVSAPGPTPTIDGSDNGPGTEIAILISLTIVAGVSAVGIGGYWFRTRRGGV